MIIPLNQHVLVERDEDRSRLVVRKSGIIAPTGQVDSEGLVIGRVLYAPKDQSLLIDKGRKINERDIVEGDYIWYSKYSTGIISDDREGHEGDFLDLIPLEDIRAIVDAPKKKELPEIVEKNPLLK